MDSMCQICKDAADKAVANGLSEEDVMSFFWNETPFPFSHPTEEQMVSLAKLTAADFSRPVDKRTL